MVGTHCQNWQKKLHRRGTAASLRPIYGKAPVNNFTAAYDALQMMDITPDLKETKTVSLINNVVDTCI